MAQHKSTSDSILWTLLFIFFGTQQHSSCLTNVLVFPAHLQSRIFNEYQKSLDRHGSINSMTGLTLKHPVFHIPQSVLCTLFPRCPASGGQRDRAQRAGSARRAAGQHAHQHAAAACTRFMQHTMQVTIRHPNRLRT